VASAFEKDASVVSTRAQPRIERLPADDGRLDAVAEQPEEEARTIESVESRRVRYSGPALGE